jgi:hypothetical protein
VNLILLLNLYFYFLVAVGSILIEMILDKESSFLHPFCVRNWNSGHKERIESNGNSIANSTDQCRFELTMEQVTNHTLVSINVLVPSLKGGLRITLSICISLFNVWLLVFLEKIFCHKVKNRINALLGVMLPITFKSHIVLS